MDNSTRQDALTGIKYGLLMGTAVLALVLPPTRQMTGIAATAAVVPTVAPLQQLQTTVTRDMVPQHRAPRYADLGSEEASDDVHRIANWVADSGDNHNLNFVILDKRNAKVFLFDTDGHLSAASPVLLGSMPGDLTVEGVGKKAIHDVHPDERTTPAGRFVAQPGRNALPEDVVWVDYDAAVSMHRVRVTDPRERRLERLASPSVEDNRISYGCINMPVKFFEDHIWPAFKGRRGIVYVLPEQLPLQQVFAQAYDPADRVQMAAQGTGMQVAAP